MRRRLMFFCALGLVFSLNSQATERVEKIFSHSEYHCFQMPKALGGEYLKIRAIYDPLVTKDTVILNSVVDLGFMEGEEILLNAYTYNTNEPSNNPNLMAIKIVLESDIIVKDGGMVESLYFVAAPRMIKGHELTEFNRKMKKLTGISPYQPHLRAYATHALENKEVLAYDIKAQRCN